jgi:hypothetical protein
MTGQFGENFQQPSISEAASSEDFDLTRTGIWSGDRDCTEVVGLEGADSSREQKTADRSGREGWVLGKNEVAGIDVGKSERDCRKEKSWRDQLREEDMIV